MAYLHLSNILHLPSCASCLIHWFYAFFNCPPPPPLAPLFMTDRWWISGRRKVRVSRVRGDQIRGLNIRVWRRGLGCSWNTARESQHASYAALYVSMRISHNRASSDSLFTWLKVSRVSRVETLQNCSELVPLCSISSPRESRGDWNHHWHTFTWINRVWVCAVGVGGGYALARRLPYGFMDNLIDSWPVNMDR